jgi:hypothetical protein
MTGKLLLSVFENNGHATLPLHLAGFSKGIYIVRVKTSQGVYCQKIFKQ